MEFIDNFQSSIGRQIPYKEWKKEELNEYKGVVQLVHGMQEHIDRYSDFANFLAENGYIVVGHSHLGHGDSVTTKEEYGYFDEKDGWWRLVEDVHLLQNKVQKKYPDMNYIIMGHSMGSLVVRSYLTKYKDNISKAIISGTSGQKYGLIAGQVLINIIKLAKGDHYRSQLVEKLITGSFNDNFKPNRTNADWLSRDEKQVDKYLADEKCGINFTLQAYQDLLKGTRYLSKQRNVNKTLNVPMLLFSGTKDPVGANGKGVIRVYRMLKKAGLEFVTLKLFEDGRHEMLNETNKEEVYQFILDWIEQR